MSKINTPQEAMFNEYNTIGYCIEQKLMNVNTILPCEIEAINANGLCDVRSLINLIGNDGKPIKPPLIHNVPYVQVRGGNAGVIIEPAVGDKVLVGFCQRDISIFKNDLERQNPGSLRKFSIMDGVILNTIVKQNPSIYVKITKDGIEINANDKDIKLNTTGNIEAKCDKMTLEATTQAIIKSPTINLEGQVNSTSTMSVGTTLSVNGKDFTTHKHTPGSYANTGGNVTGTSGEIL